MKTKAYLSREEWCFEESVTPHLYVYPTAAGVQYYYRTMPWVKGLRLIFLLGPIVFQVFILMNVTSLSPSARLCFKMFLVMGVTWLTEIVAHAVTPFVGATGCTAFLVTNVLNGLRGLFIFFIFVCNRSVSNKVRHSSLRGFFL